MSEHLLLLPGLHGTDALFDDFVAKCPPGFQVTTVSYPETVRSGDDALEYAETHLPDSAVVVGESFSSPIAVRLAARFPARVKGLILVGGFVLSPGPGWFRHLPLRPLLFATRPLASLAAPLFGSLEMARRVRGELARSPAAVLADRLRAVYRTDVRDDLAALEMPILYLSGRRDWIVPGRCRRPIERLVHRLTVCELDSTHMILQTRPQEAWGCIESFWEDRLPRRREE